MKNVICKDCGGEIMFADNGEQISECVCQARRKAAAIPEDVYWHPEHVNFYDGLGNGKGLSFFKMWNSRRDLFPQSQAQLCGVGDGMEKSSDEQAAAQEAYEAGQSMVRDAHARTLGMIPELGAGYAGAEMRAREAIAERRANCIVHSVEEMLSDRGERYGEFAGHAKVTQQLKLTMKQHRKGNHAGPVWSKLANDQREALEMIQHKIGRILNGDPDHIDSWDDIAGYATLVAKRLRSAVYGGHGAYCDECGGVCKGHAGSAIGMLLDSGQRSSVHPFNKLNGAE